MCYITLFLAGHKFQTSSEHVTIGTPVLICTYNKREMGVYHSVKLLNGFGRFSYVLFLLYLGLTNGEAQTGAFQQTFKAAVYEHAVVTPTDPETIVSRDEALANMMKNLDTYRIQAEIAGNMVNI